MEKALLTIGEAAQYLGVSIDTLRRWDKKGILPSVRVMQNGHRYYSQHSLDLLYNDLFRLAEEWVEKEIGVEPDHDLYCPTRDIFQNRLVKMENILDKMNNLSTPFSLISAVVGELGNNSFDHNLGNWRDLPGIFFGYNMEKKCIVLADRGQGILRTLQRVKPELKNDAEAMKVAFTEVITGRAPERRGNGLKFVKEQIIVNPLTLVFETGNVKLNLKKDDKELTITEQTPTIHGCIAVIRF